MKTLFFFFQTVIPLLIACFFIKKNQLAQVIPFFVLIVIGSNAFTSVFVVPWTMLPEVLDEYFLVYKYKPDALFYTYFLIGAKILTAVYSAVNQLVLEQAFFSSKQSLFFNSKRKFLQNLKVWLATKVACASRRIKRRLLLLQIWSFCRLVCYF